MTGTADAALRRAKANELSESLIKSFPHRAISVTFLQAVVVAVLI